jgi:hypothetical protein
MSDAADLLLERIGEVEALATGDPGRLRFWEWLAGEGRHDRRYGGAADAQLGDDEVELLRRFDPDAVRVQCAEHREIIEACRAALTYRQVEGMSSARILAEITMQHLMRIYAVHSGRAGAAS